MPDNDAKLQLSARGFATAMANRVVRERKRIAAFLDDQANVMQGAGTWLDGHIDELRAMAETIRTGAYSGSAGTIVPADRQPEPEDDSDDIPDDGLPPHRDRDDFEDGLSILSARSTAQRLGQRRGGAFGSMVDD